jgi:hypothetical protein
MSDIMNLVFEQISSENIVSAPVGEHSPATTENIALPDPDPVLRIGTIELIGSEFSLLDVRRKFYECDEDLIFDLSLLLRFLNDSDTFVFKTWCSGTEEWVIEGRKWGQMKNMLSSISLTYGDTDKYTAWDCLSKYVEMLSVNGLEFSDQIRENYYNLFHGWYYDRQAQTQTELIVPFLKFVGEIICDGERVVYDWILSWIATIVQRVGKRTETAIILQGDEGIGKNVFTNCIAELLRGYFIPNLSDIGLLVWSFNEIIRGKVLVVVNEMENATKKMSEKLRSLITEETVVIKQKYVKSQVDKNITNFIFVTNNTVPVRLGPTDRRYLTVHVSPKRIKDLAYFADLQQRMTPDFYVTLHRFFATYDISRWDAREIPFTWAKAELIMENTTTIEQFCIENYEELKDGMTIVRLYAKMPRGMSKDKFGKGLAKYTTRFRPGERGNQQWGRKLTPDAVVRFGPTARKMKERERSDEGGGGMEVESLSNNIDL